MKKSIKSLTDCLKLTLKKILPSTFYNLIRSVATAVLTPIYFSFDSGHFLSSLKRAANSKEGWPIPWYTFPCIDYLSKLNYSNLAVLEFGGGQSSLWWSERADYIRVFDESQKRVILKKVTQELILLLLKITRKM